MNTTDRHPAPTDPRHASTRLTALTCLLLAVAMHSAMPGTSQASTPNEKVVCTQAPRTEWMTEAAARKLFKADTYALVKFKISKGNCHEFYAVDHQGGVVEAYLHPVTGAQVRITRIPAPVQTHSNPQGVKP